jgi:hypothetical protein
VAKSVQAGVTASANANPEPSPINIAKIRRTLKLLDLFLQLMEQKSP